jgi:hypothetical protein
MNSEQDLLNKLVISKKIMEKHNAMGRGSSGEAISQTTPMVEDFQPVSANYNLPNDLLMEANIPKESTPPTKDKILNSRLPDEIKRLMLEHPIDQPSMGGPTLSNDLVDKAARLMNLKSNGEKINEHQTTTPRQNTATNNIGLNSNDIREIVRETVEDVLKENGLLVESTTRSDEAFKFRVGNHIFEGKLTKIKKIQK